LPEEEVIDLTEEADDQDEEGDHYEDLMKSWTALFQPSASVQAVAQAGGGTGLGLPRFANHNSTHKEEIRTWPENEASMCSV
jgi:hypothetical protein